MREVSCIPIIVELNKPFLWFDFYTNGQKEFHTFTIPNKISFQVLYSRELNKICIPVNIFNNQYLIGKLSKDSDLFGVGMEKRFGGRENLVKLTIEGLLRILNGIELDKDNFKNGYYQMKNTLPRRASLLNNTLTLSLIGTNGIVFWIPGRLFEELHEAKTYTVIELPRDDSIQPELEFA